jgi:PhnB protein
MQIQPYLFFDGRAEEAIEFYQKALGAKVEMMIAPDRRRMPARRSCTPPLRSAMRS